MNEKELSKQRESVRLGLSFMFSEDQSAALVDLFEVTMSFIGESKARIAALEAKVVELERQKQPGIPIRLTWDDLYRG